MCFQINSIKDFSAWYERSMPFIQARGKYHNSAYYLPSWEALLKTIQIHLRLGKLKSDGNFIDYIIKRILMYWD